MKRTTRNFITDALAFIGFVFLVATGLIMRYMLPPGSGSHLGDWLGRGKEGKTVTLLWGLDRHEWGEIHFWIAFALLVVLAVHLVFHWGWIAGIVQGKPGQGSGPRVGLGFVGLIAVLALAVTPFFSPRGLETRGGKKLHPELHISPSNEIPSETQIKSTGPKEPLIPKKHKKDSAEKKEVPSKKHVEKKEGKKHDKGTANLVGGSMTLREVEEQTGVPIPHLLEHLGLPNDTSPVSRLGQLRSRYGFEMEEVRKIVNDYKK